MKNEVPLVKRRNIVKYLIDGFYHEIDKPVIFNTNRNWTYVANVVKDLLPEAKMIVCVRDINWIIDSFELVHRKNPFSVSSVFPGGHAGNVYTRAKTLMENDTGIISSPYLGLKQAMAGPEKDMLHILEYEHLTKNPEQALRAIYEFIGEPYFEHDFDNVQGSWDEYDEEIGINLHTVKKKVEFVPREHILPPDILNSYKDMEFWR